MCMEAQGRYLQLVLEKAKDLLNLQPCEVQETTKFDFDSNEISHYSNTPLHSMPKLHRMSNEKKQPLAQEFLSVLYPEPNQPCPTSSIFPQDLSRIGKRSQFENAENTDFSLLSDGILVNEPHFMHGNTLIDEDARHVTLCANSKTGLDWEYNAYENLSHSMW